MRADTLFYNGNFFTPSHQKINWLAIKEGWIISLGTGTPDRHLLVQEKVNLEKKCIFPGWIDAHIHLMLLGQRKFEVDVSQCRSLDELKNVLKKAWVRKKDREPWLEAYGADPERWSQTLTAQVLDQVSLRIPILVRRKDEHALWVNSCLLKKVRLNQSHPAGYLVGQDTDVIFRLRPPLSSQKINLQFL